MTQNQIAYWANVEKERANRQQEEIARTKAWHDIVQGYYKSTPGGTVAQATAGTLIGRSLGVDTPYDLAKDNARSEAKRYKSKISSVFDIIRNAFTGSSKKVDRLALR